LLAVLAHSDPASLDLLDEIRLHNVVSIAPRNAPLGGAAPLTAVSRTPSIRPGVPADIEAVAAIKVANWRDTYAQLITADVLASFLDRAHAVEELRDSTSAADANFLVAQDSQGDLIGFSLAYLDQEPDPWLESLHVASAARGRGVGTALMREVAHAIRVRGRNSLRLGVVKGNRGAGRLYERLGAALVAIEPTAWARGVDHEIYRWADLSGLVA
jgi:ribosomal protein S18 acetylase RimI-like enzyme